MIIAPRCVSLHAESEAGVVGAGPEGAGPQRAPVTLHLPRAAAGSSQRCWHAPQNLHSPQEVRGRSPRCCQLIWICYLLVVTLSFRFSQYMYQIRSFWGFFLFQRFKRLHHPAPPWWHSHSGVYRHQGLLLRRGLQHQSPAAVLELSGENIVFISAALRYYLICLEQQQGLKRCPHRPVNFSSL